MDEIKTYSSVLKSNLPPSPLKRRSNATSEPESSIKPKSPRRNPRKLFFVRRPELSDQRFEAKHILTLSLPETNRYLSDSKDEIKPPRHLQHQEQRYFDENIPRENFDAILQQNAVLQERGLNFEKRIDDVLQQNAVLQERDLEFQKRFDIVLQQNEVLQKRDLDFQKNLDIVLQQNTALEEKNLNLQQKLDTSLQQNARLQEQFNTSLQRNARLQEQYDTVSQAAYRRDSILASLAEDWLVAQIGEARAKGLDILRGRLGYLDEGVTAGKWYKELRPTKEVFYKLLQKAGMEEWSFILENEKLSLKRNHLIHNVQPKAIQEIVQLLKEKRNYEVLSYLK